MGPAATSGGICEIRELVGDRLSINRKEAHWRIPRFPIISTFLTMNPECSLQCLRFKAASIRLYASVQPRRRYHHRPVLLQRGERSGA